MQTASAEGKAGRGGGGGRDVLPLQSAVTPGMCPGTSPTPSVNFPHAVRELPLRRPGTSPTPPELPLRRLGDGGLSRDAVLSAVALAGRCSALIKVAADLSDVFVGHSTWDSYTSALTPPRQPPAGQGLPLASPYRTALAAAKQKKTGAGAADEWRRGLTAVPAVAGDLSSAPASQAVLKKCPGLYTLSDASRSRRRQQRGGRSEHSESGSLYRRATRLHAYVTACCMDGGATTPHLGHTHPPSRRSSPACAQPSPARVKPLTSFRTR
eukprot:360817-Chlamydomonas_euryale.AAC.1